MLKIAIIGSGIAGLSSAWLLARGGHAVTHIEAQDRPGGHKTTVDMTLDGATFLVDTGFLVFNDRTYPRLVELFDTLDVDSIASEMSFSCRVDSAGLVWSETDIAALFAQRRNALRPGFWRMLFDIARFSRATTLMLARRELRPIPLGAYLDA